MDDSVTRNLNAEGEVSFERMMVHAAIFEDLLAGHEPRERAEVVFTAGGAASGKTRLLESLGLLEGALRIDMDDIRLRLPEYTQWLEEVPDQAAALTHREASDLAKRVLSIALKRGLSIIYDSVGADDTGKFSEKVRAALTCGAVVRICYATVPVELAMEREQERFERTGRRVPEAELRKGHAAASRGLTTASQLAVERIEIYDTRGDEPVLIAHGPGGDGPDGLQVVDPERYAEFLEKGKE